MDVVEHDPAGATALIFAENDKVLSKVTSRFFAFFFIVQLAGRSTI